MQKYAQDHVEVRCLGKTVRSICWGPALHTVNSSAENTYELQFWTTPKHGFLNFGFVVSSMEIVKCKLEVQNAWCVHYGYLQIRSQGTILHFCLGVRFWKAKIERCKSEVPNGGKLDLKATFYIFVLDYRLWKLDDASWRFKIRGTYMTIPHKSNLTQYLVNEILPRNMPNMLDFW